ncbi:protein of unknown function [Candidatus Hydrogenisulfobacillus filiaventi]|uniref:Uncharacterized protein n=1 Tax=Candidatus Hydrogenisulfobacillus filiaventi TaxID=2707344 RepID=A0A6F8ZFR2_9FIRM|nr:protein of unknown function [Candidatus Hydrogenisulfobacillus filiaventi]
MARIYRRLWHRLAARIRALPPDPGLQLELLRRIGERLARGYRAAAAAARERLRAPGTGRPSCAGRVRPTGTAGRQPGRGGRPATAGTGHGRTPGGNRGAGGTASLGDRCRPPAPPSPGSP